MDYIEKRWITLICTVPLAICFGSFYAWSVFSIPLSEKLGLSVAAVTVAFSICSGCSGIMNIVGGALYDRLGARFALSIGGILFAGGYVLTGFTNSYIWLIVSYGILVGCGLGVGYCTFLTNTANAFPEMRGTATGIVIAGYGSGAFVFAPLSNFLIDSFGVLNAFKILGIIVFVLIVILAQFIRKPPAGFVPEGWHPDKANKVIFQTRVDQNWKQMLRDPLYYMITGMIIFSTSAGLMVMGHGSAIAQSIADVTPAVAAWIVGIVSIANACGRFLIPTVSDRIGRSRALMFAFLLWAAVMIALVLVKPGQVTFLTILMLAMGFCYGGSMGVFPAITTDSFGTKNSGTNFGFVFIGVVFGSIIGPTLASLVIDHTGKYTFAFLSAALLCIIGVVFAALAGRMIKSRI